MRFAALLSAFAVGVALTAAASAEPNFSPHAIQSHVAFLADDLLEGRGTGTRGHEIAVRYVVSQFTALGLTPGGDEGGWYKRVAFREGSHTKVAELTITGPQGAQTWLNGTEVLLTPSMAQAEQDIEAPVVFAGFGIDAPQQGFDDYRGLDVRGKYVAYFDGTPKGTPSEIGAHLAEEKARMAEARGAIGVLVINTLSLEEAWPWAGRLKTATQPRVTWIDAKGHPFAGAPGIKARSMLNGMAAAALFAGTGRSFQSLQKQADQPNARLRGFPLKVKARIKRSTQYQAFESPQVLGFLPGSDPGLKNEIIIFTAHLDHLGMREKAQGDQIYNGALDNAAGIATMIEVARAFASGPRPRRSMLFVATTAEEKSMLGSEALSNDPSLPLSQIVGAVNLDMPILTYDFTDVVAFGAEHSTLGQSVARAAGRMGVTLSPDPMPETGFFVRSDHYPFVKKGVPAVSFATGFANGGEQAWQSYLSKRYHEASDDLTQKIDWQVGAKFARINYLVASEIANSDAPPRWYKGDFFGDAFAPNASKAPRPTAQ